MKNLNFFIFDISKHKMTYTIYVLYLKVRLLIEHTDKQMLIFFKCLNVVYFRNLQCLIIIV